MFQKLKLLTAFICGAIFFSGVSYAANTLTVQIVDFKIVVNGKEQNLSEKPVLINNRTYLPIRDIGTMTGYEVSYKNGVVTLTNKKENSDTSNDQKSESSESNELEFEFKKIPITITKGEITVTVNSVYRGENDYTIFDITITNNSDEDVEIDYKGYVMGANYKVPGKQYTTVGTISRETVFSKPIKAGSTVTGVIYKSTVEEGTENVIFHIKVGTQGFSFYIDTKGVL